MAGLHYNFFPTDFYYPRPRSVPADADRVAAITIQTPKKEVDNDLEWPRSLGFRVHRGKNKVHSSRAGASMYLQVDQNEGKPFAKDGGTLVKHSQNPGFLFNLVPEELS